MDIDVKGTGDQLLQSAREAARQENKTPAQPTPTEQATAPSSTRDTVSLTDTAGQLSQLQNAVASLPVVDTDRVEAVRQALANGTFEVDPQRTADKLVDFESILDGENR